MPRQASTAAPRTQTVHGMHHAQQHAGHAQLLTRSPVVSLTMRIRLALRTLHRAHRHDCSTKHKSAALLTAKDPDRDNALPAHVPRTTAAVHKEQAHSHQA
jgi:hypothetical protein